MDLGWLPSRKVVMTPVVATSVNGVASGIEDVDPEPSEAVEQELAHEAPIVHVEPFGARDEHPDIPWLPVLRRGEEEVNVKTGETAGDVAPC